MTEIIYEQGPMKEDETPLRKYRKVNEGLDNEQIVEIVHDSKDFPPFLVDTADREYFDNDVFKAYGNDLFKQVSTLDLQSYLSYYDNDDDREQDLYHADGRSFIHFIDENSPNTIPYTRTVDGIDHREIKVVLFSGVQITRYDSFTEFYTGGSQQDTTRAVLTIDISIEFDDKGNRTTELEADGTGVIIRNAHVVVGSSHKRANEGTSIPEDSEYIDTRIHKARIDFESRTLTVMEWSDDEFDSEHVSERRSIQTGINPTHVALDALSKMHGDYRGETFEAKYSTWFSPQGQYDWKFWGLDEKPKSLETKEDRGEYGYMGREAAGVTLFIVAEQKDLPHPEVIADAAHRVALNSYVDNFMDLVMCGYESGVSEELIDRGDVESLLLYAELGSVGLWYDDEPQKASDDEIIKEFKKLDRLVEFGKLLARFTDKSVRESVLERMKLFATLDKEQGF